VKFYRPSITALVLLIVLAGCGIVRESPDLIRSYLLEIPGGDSGGRVQRSSEIGSLPSLLLGVPEPAPGFESSRMAYVQVPHELNYFAMSQWVESPAGMLTPLLVQSLENSGMWRSVTPMPTSIRADYRLDLTQVVLVQEFLQQPSHVRLEWRGQLVDLKDWRVLGSRKFVREEEAVSEDAYGGVLAAQEALRHLLLDFHEWLVGCLKEDSSAHC